MWWRSLWVWVVRDLPYLLPYKHWTSHFFGYVFNSLFIVLYFSFHLTSRHTMSNSVFDCSVVFMLLCCIRYISNGYYWRWCWKFIYSLFGHYSYIQNSTTLLSLFCCWWCVLSFSFFKFYVGILAVYRTFSFCILFVQLNDRLNTMKISLNSYHPTIYLRIQNSVFVCIDPMKILNIFFKHQINEQKMNSLVEVFDQYKLYTIKIWYFFHVAWMIYLVYIA